MEKLNLYGGFGGNSLLWDDEVTMVEKDEKIAKVYQDNHKAHKVIIGDAHKYLLDHFEEYGFVWSSPPCQAESKMVKATRHRIRKYPSLTVYQEVIFLQHFFKGKWVVENVRPYYEPLIRPTAEIGRHLFWSNFRITQPEHINHDNFIQADSPEEIESMKKWLGISYEGNIYYEGNHSPGQVLRNCVHPEIGLHVLNCALEIEPKQIGLFA